MSADVERYEITLHRTELVPGGNGALIGFSEDFPDKRFLIVPESGRGFHVETDTTEDKQ